MVLYKNNNLKPLFKLSLIIFFSSLFFLLTTTSVKADKTWDGGGGADTNWSTLANWTLNTLPTNSEVAIFNGTSSNNVTISSNIDVKGISIAAGYGGTITQNSTKTITLGTSGFSQATGTFLGGDSLIDVNGDFIISGGAFTSTSGSLTISGSFTKTNSPTFTHNSGTVTFDGTTSASTSIDASGFTFNLVTISRTISSATTRTLTIVSGTTLPLGNTATITLSNTLGSTFFYHLTNNGIINIGTNAFTANVDGTFSNTNQVNGTNTSFVMNGSFSNSATLSMPSSSTFDFNTYDSTGGSLTNSGTGTFTTAANPNFTISGSFIVATSSTFPSTNTNVDFDGTSLMDSLIDADGVTFLSPVTISRTISVTTSYTLTVDTGTTIPLGNTPSITLYNSLSFAYLYNLTNNGTITTGTGIATTTIDGTFTNAGTISGSNSSWVINGSFVNTGTVTMTSSTSFDINQYDSAGGSFSNNGTSTFTSASNPTFSVNGSFIVSNTSSFPTSPVSNVNLTLDTGAVCASAGYSIDAPSVTFDTPVLISKSTTNTGADCSLTIALNTTLPLGNTATITLNNSSGFKYSLTNSGTITVGSGVFTANVDGDFTNGGTMSGSNTSMVINGSLINNGSISMGSSSTFQTKYNTSAGVGNFTNSSTGSFVTGANPSFTSEGSFIVHSSSTFPTTNVTLSLSSSNGCVGTSTIDASIVTFVNPVTINRAPSNTSGDCTLAISAGTTLPFGDTTNLITNNTSGFKYNFTNSGVITVGNSSLTLSTDGTFTNAGTISGNITSLTLNTTFVNSGTLTLTSLTTLDVNSYNGGDGSLTNSASAVITTASSPTFTIQKDINVNVSSTFPASVSLILDGTTGTQTVTNPNATAYGSFSKTGASSLTLSSGFNTANFIFSGGTISNPASPYSINITGDFTQSSAGTLGGANLTITFEGSNNQSFSKTAGSFSSVLNVNKSGGALSLTGDTTTLTNTCTVTSGVFFLNEFDFICGSTFTVLVDGTLRLVGNEITITTPVLNTGSTVDYVGDNDGLADTFLINDWSYSNLTVNFTDSIDTLSSNQADILQTESFERVTFPPPSYLTGGNLNWSKTSSQFQSGANSAVSGSISTSQTSYLQKRVRVYADTTVTFYWKVSSEVNDFLLFCLNNDACTRTSGYNTRISGEVDWAQVSIPLSAGINSLDWKYASNISVTSGSNVGWVDNIVLNGAGSAIGTINVAKNFTLTSGTFKSPSTLNIGGNYANNGGVFTNNSGTVVMNSTGTGNTLGGTMTSTSSFYNLTFNGIGGEWSFDTNPVNVNNDFTITQGSVTSSSSTLTVSGNYSNSGTFLNNSGTVLLNATDAGNTLAGTLSGATGKFYNLTFNGSGGSWGFTSNPAVEVNNNFNILSGSVTSTSNTLTISGNYNNSGTFTHNSGTVIINPPSLTKTLTGSMTTTSSFYNLTFSGSGDSTFGVIPVTVVNDFRITGNGNVTAPSTILTISGSFTDSTGKFVHNSGTVLMNSNTSGKSVNQNISAIPFYNLTFNGSGDWDLDATGIMKVDNNFTITSGTVFAPSSQLHLKGNYSNAGTFTHNSGTVFMTAVTPGHTLSGTMTGTSAFNNLTFTGISGAWSFGANSATVNNNLTITNGAVTAPSTTLDVAGNYSNAGTFTHNSGTLLFNATDAGNTIAGTLSGVTGKFYNLTFNGLGGEWSFTSNPAVEIANDLNITQGTLTSTSNILTITGNYSNSGTFTNNSGSVLFNATDSGNTLSGNMITTSMFNNLTFNGSGGAWTFGTNAGTVANDLTITNGEVTAPSSTLTLTGNYSNSGTFLNNSGTVILNATDAGNTLAGTLSGVTGKFYNLTFNGSGGSWSFVSNPEVETANDFTITLGTVTSTSGTLTIKGNYSNSGTFTNNSGTVLMNATDVGNTLSGTMTTPSEFNNLTFNSSGSWSFGANPATILNDFIITQGSITAPSTTLTVSHNFSNLGTFVHNSGTVILNGTLQTISGNTSFNNLSKTVTSPDTLYYEGHVSNTTTVAGTWTMKGTLGNLLTLYSTNSPTKWRIAPLGTRDIEYLSVKESNNVDSTIIAVDGLNLTNEGYNVNWGFNQNPLEPFNLAPTSLMDGSWTNDNTPTFSFDLSDPDLNTTKYQIQIDNNLNFLSPELSYTSSLSAITSRTFNSPELSDDSYYWRVKAIDSLNAESNWVTANGVLVAFKIDTTPSSIPNAPSTTTPTANSTPTWTWNASTDIGGVGLHTTPYTINWCLLNTFVGCGSNIATSNTNSYTHTGGLTSGTWYIRVKSKDLLNNESSYSANGSVLISTEAPVGSITINSGDLYTSSTLMNLTLTASDNFDDATALLMKISNNPSFTGSSYEPYSNSSTYTFDNTNGTKTIYLKLKNTLGTESNVFTDTIVFDTSAPTDLSYIYPVNITINVPRPEYKWHKATDSLSKIGKYILTVTFEDSTNFVLDNLESFEDGLVNSYDRSKYTIRKDGEYIYLVTKDSGLWGGSENNGILKNGIVNVNVQAYDMLGNVLASQNTFTYDSIPPAFVLNSIDSNTNLNILPNSVEKSYTLTNNKPVFRGDVSSQDLSEINIVANSTSQSPRTCTTSTSQAWECRITTALTNGIWRVSVTAKDVTGNISSLPTITLNITSQTVETILIEEPVNNPPSNLPVDTPPVNQPLENNYSLVLTILDSNKKPLVGAVVTLPNDDNEYITDQNGKVTINNIKEGAYNVIVNYKDSSGEHTVSIYGVNTNQNKTIELILNDTDTNMRAVLIAIALLLLVILLIIIRKKRSRTSNNIPQITPQKYPL